MSNEEQDEDVSEVTSKQGRLRFLNPIESTNRILEGASSLYEGVTFAVSRRFMNACIHGLYVYDKNSSGLFFGSATFYGLLSIIPVFSCATFMLGLFQNDMAHAHQQLFTEIKAIIHVSSHGLLTQISELTQSHLKNTPLTFLNLALLTWTAKGFFSTLVDGLRDCASPHRCTGLQF